jgi:hypothetical protein
MITAPSALQDHLKQSSSIKMLPGCTIEYNMNALTNLTEDSITGPSYAVVGGKDAFKKIFPLDSVIKANRPLYAGVKYAIFGDMATGDYRDPRTTTYPINYRIYYPGIDTHYKYWVSNEGQGGTITITYPKTIVANKITVKFEVSHAVPPTWTVYGTPAGGSEGSLATGTSSAIPTISQSNPGVLNLYYTGSTWSTNAALHNTSAHVSLTSIKLTFGGVAAKYIGVIEFSARWVKDISDTVVSLSMNKESSSSRDDILPVGNVSANSMQMAINKYNTSSMQIIAYEKDNSFAIDTSKIYLYKDVELKPYFDIYHSNGVSGTAPNKYDRVYQGTFFVDSFNIAEFGDVNIVALDGAKILQETLCPPVLCENYSITAIFRRLLDNIGFTNYNFNLTATDQSVISPNYWWADDSTTVWQAIQELCRDTQMTAVFDENNILQFYSRDYMYSDRSSSWDFTSTANGSTLPNIISLEKDELPSANQVKILWQSAVTSNYERNSEPIWKSDTTYLAAAALIDDLDSTNVVDGSPERYITLRPISTVGNLEDPTGTQLADQLVLYAFSGFLVIEDEIIEYDGIEYDYWVSGVKQAPVIIRTDSDVFKYRALADAGSQNFKPSGRYKIKNRGAFNTTVVPHRSGSENQITSWTVNEVTFK